MGRVSFFMSFFLLGFIQLRPAPRGRDSSENIRPITRWHGRPLRICRIEWPVNIAGVGGRCRAAIFMKIS
jgi:hypothetical protein